MGKGILFIASPGARNKREALFREIVSRHTGYDYSSVLYVAPNNYVISEAGSNFFSCIQANHKEPAFIPFQFQTIKHFAHSLYKTIGDRKIITDRIRVLILSDILKDKSIGYATILSDLLTKILHYLPDRDLPQVKEDINNLIFEEKAAARAVRAIEILETYESEMKRKNLIDTEHILKENIHPPAWNSFPYSTLVIDGFFDPTPLELNNINMIIRHVEKVYIMAEEHTEIVKYLRSNISGIKINKLPCNSFRGKTGFFSYSSIEEEVEGIARNIKKLILEGTRPWEITVSFPVLSKYLPMLKRVFHKYGIPANPSEQNLSSTRPLVALDEMITCIEEDYSRSDFLSLLTSLHFPAIPEIVREKAVHYSYKAGVVKGKDSWLSIKETLLNSMGDNFTGDEKIMLDEFQHGIKLVINTIENIKQEDRAGPFIDSFESALVKFGFFDSLDNPELFNYGEKILNRINNQLAELRYFAGLFKDSGQNINPPVFYLKYLLSALKGPEENRDGVKITPFELAAGIETKALFFGGMIEGDFPSRPDIDPILPEGVKKKLGIPHLEYYLKRQKRYFKRLLNVSLLDPYFSCPSADGDKMFLPSPFLDWEQSMTPVDLNVFSEEEALIREGAGKRFVKDFGFPHAQRSANDKREMFRSRKAFGLLLRRIASMTKGYFSVTNIDFYRKCPLRFYIEKVLGLEITIPPRYEVEARLWGSLAHKTMEYLFKEGDVEPDDIEQKILEGLEKSLKQFPVGDFWAKVAREIFLTRLPSIREQESDIRMQGFAPFKVEEKLKAEINGLKLKGNVDRADRKAQSMETTTGDSVILLDYKTGNIDRNSLQLPLYAAMWRKTFGETADRLGYYSLKEGKVSWFPGKKMTMEEFIENALESAADLSGQMQKGKFPPEPFRADECRYCYHKPLCSNEGPK